MFACLAVATARAGIAYGGGGGYGGHGLAITGRGLNGGHGLSGGLAAGAGTAASLQGGASSLGSGGLGASYAAGAAAAAGAAGVQQIVSGGAYLRTKSKNFISATMQNTSMLNNCSFLLQESMVAGLTSDPLRDPRPTLDPRPDHLIS